MSKVPKDYKPLVKAAKKAGWSSRNGTKHFIMVSPDGTQQVAIPGSPGANKRSLENTRADFRRAGVPV